MENKLDPKEMEALSRERIIYIIENFCDGNRMELARRAGIGKSSISQYVNGTNAPGNITAAKIGDAFGIDPMWIMGFDVPMKKLKLETIKPLFGNESEEEQEIRRLLVQMTQEEKEELLNYIKFIISKRK